eukprot:gene3510-13581_t
MSNLTRLAIERTFYHAKALVARRMPPAAAQVRGIRETDSDPSAPLIADLANTNSAPLVADLVLEMICRVEVSAGSIAPVLQFLVHVLSLECPPLMVGIISSPIPVIHAIRLCIYLSDRMEERDSMNYNADLLALFTFIHTLIVHVPDISEQLLGIQKDPHPQALPNQFVLRAEECRWQPTITSVVWQHLVAPSFIRCLFNNPFVTSQSVSQDLIKILSWESSTSVSQDLIKILSWESSTSVSEDLIKILSWESSTSVSQDLIKILSWESSTSVSEDLIKILSWESSTSVSQDLIKILSFESSLSVSQDLIKILSWELSQVSIAVLEGVRDLLKYSYDSQFACLMDCLPDLVLGMHDFLRDNRIYTLYNGLPSHNIPGMQSLLTASYPNLRALAWYMVTLLANASEGNRSKLRDWICNNRASTIEVHQSFAVLIDAPDVDEDCKTRATQ